MNRVEISSSLVSLPAPKGASAPQEPMESALDLSREIGVINRPKQNVLEDLAPEALFSQIDAWEAEGGKEREIEEAFTKLAQLPFSFDLIHLVVKRRGKPISKGERKLMVRLRQELPDLNKALLSYDLLQRETDRMDLERFRKTELQIGDETFEAYDTTGADYRFIVHAAGPDEGAIESVKKKRIRSGFLCTSLISNECSDFFEHQKNYAMVLSVDSRNIVATTREDAYTPYTSNDPYTMRYYRFYQRLQLLTGAVERLCREAGNQPLGDRLSRLNRLHSLHEMGSNDPEISRQIQELSKDLHWPGSEYESYQGTGLTLLKLREALHALSELPGHESLQASLKACSEELEKIQSEYGIFHDHIHPIQGVGELLAQTPHQRPHSYNKYGVRPFNEVNLDLETRYRGEEDPIAVRAVLIDRKAFTDNPAKFAAVLADAKANGIPILLREDPVLPIEAVRVRLMRAILDKESSKVQYWLEKPGIDEETVGAGLVLAVANKAGCDICNQLLDKGVSDRSLLQALELAVKDDTEIVLRRLLYFKPSETERWAAAYAAAHPENIPGLLAEFLLEWKIPLSDQAALAALSQAVRTNDPGLLIRLYNACKNQIPEEDLAKAFRSVIFNNWFRVKIYLPVELAAQALRYALDKRLDRALGEILTHEPFLAVLSPQEVEAGFIAAAQICFDSDFAAIFPKHYGLSDACIRQAFEGAVQKDKIGNAALLLAVRRELLRESGVAAVVNCSDRWDCAKLLIGLAFPVEDIPREIALKAYEAAVQNSEPVRPELIRRRFPDLISGEPLREVWKRMILDYPEVVDLALPQELGKWAFAQALEMGSKYALVSLARSVRLREEISVENVEAAIRQGVRRGSETISVLVGSRPEAKERLARVALKEYAACGRTRFVLECFCNTAHVSHALLDEILDKGPKNPFDDDTEFTVMKASDFIGYSEASKPPESPVEEDKEFTLLEASDFIGYSEAREERREITLLELYVEEAAAMAGSSSTVAKAAKGIGKRAPSLAPKGALALAQLAYAGMQLDKFHEPLLEILSSLSEEEFFKVRDYLIKYAGMPDNRGKFGSAAIDALIRKLNEALSPREKLMKEAEELAKKSASVPQVIKAVQKRASSIDAAQAGQVAQLAYAAMQDEKFLSSLLERLVQIPEPEFSKVKQQLLKYVRMPGNQEKFGQNEALQAHLSEAESAVEPLPVQKGNLEKREVAVQPAVTLGSLPGMALSAIKAPFHLASWAASGLFSACRRKAKLA